MTTALEGVSGRRHAPAVLYPRERPGTHCTGGWVGPRTGLDGRKISPYRDYYVHVQTHNHLTTPTKLATFILVPLWALNSVIELAQ